MAQLDIRLLGSFQVSLGSQSVTNFESVKVRALLAYLVVESGQAHLREKLADLLWPDMLAKRANSNLNQALYNLRGVIRDHQAKPPYLLRSYHTVQFNPQSDYWLDVDAFQKGLAGIGFQCHSHVGLNDGDLEALKAVVEQYRGDFLDGLFFDISSAFDEWVLIVRQRLQQHVLKGLSWLVEAFYSREDYSQALAYAQRQVELDPLGESAHRQLMRLLAVNGQRSKALAQFKHLQTLLAQELNIPPEPETLALRDRIRG